MATADPLARDRFEADLRDALQEANTAHAKKTDKARDKIFGMWTNFCRELSVDPSLSDVPGHETKIAYLLVFGLRYRRVGQKSKSVRSSTVKDALLAVGSGIANLGAHDPRKQTPGSHNYHPLLENFFDSLEKRDDPASHAYPANIIILRQMYEELELDDPIDGPVNRHVINLSIAGFFWLLRPAEYTLSEAERSQAFRLQDVTITTGDQVYSATDDSLNDVNDDAVTSASLTFADQKNCVRGEQVAQKATNDPWLCPAKALHRITKHLRLHNAPPDTPLCAYYDSANKLSYVTPQWITNGLRHAARSLDAFSDVDLKPLSTCSLRPEGATAFLCANIDKDTIMLLG